MQESSGVDLTDFNRHGAPSSPDPETELLSHSSSCSPFTSLNHVAARRANVLSGILRGRRLRASMSWRHLHRVAMRQKDSALHAP